MKLKDDKLAGRAKPKNQPQIVEQHFDDCGSDFGPISCYEIALRDTFEQTVTSVAVQDEMSVNFFQATLFFFHLVVSSFSVKSSSESL